ncbi:hypothetical protein QTP70_023937, partial [Hemibagrus guttatus]
MLQTISPELLPFITTVINGSLTSGHVPTAFKKARVIPILKKPALDPSDISNYRPNNLHDPNQSGFKAAHSTETALLAVTEKLHAARSAKLSSVLILLDLSAAFDTVNHKTLLSTLRSLGICGTAWEWFASYLDGRSYQELEEHGMFTSMYFIHSFIHCVPLIRTILGSRGACVYLRRHWASRQDTPWTECQPITGHTHTLSFTHTVTHYGQFRDANQPTMSLDWGRKPAHPEETPEARGEHANSTHMVEVGIEPPTLE